jgi:hypothetical protein
VAGHFLVLKPVAQALFRELFGLEVVPHRQAAGEEHRRHLGGGLADLHIERFRFLDDENAELGQIPAEKQGGRRAAEGAAEHDYVVVMVHRSHSSGVLRCAAFLQ